MRTKLILWGKTENDEKVLVAIELVEEENKVKTYVFKEDDATEEFYNLLLNEWRFDKEIEFPSEYKTYEKTLTAAEDILPEGILVDKPDLISRAKSEWHFVVLSKKLYDLYKDELEDLKEKVNDLSEFSSDVWDDLKGFWSKVQTHVKEKNLFRNHVESLKNKTDELFQVLKQLRNKTDAEFREKSQQYFDEFNAKLDEIEEKIEKGLGLQPIFEELKVIQKNFKEISFDRDHRRKLWNRIDKEFKKVKEKRFGSASNDRSPLARLQRRLNGLMGAIEKMNASIERDKKELEANKNKIGNSDGQLEVELRKARLMMIEERITSKSEKFQDMLKTKEMLESRIQNELRKEEERKKYEEAKKEAEKRIKEKVKESSKLLQENEEDLKKASDKIKDTTTTKKDKKVISDKAGIIDDVKDKAEDLAEKAGEVFDEVKDKAEDIIDEVKDKAENLTDKAEEIFDDVKEKAEDFSDKAEDIIEDVVEKAGTIAGTIMKKVKETIDEVKDKLEEE